MAAVILILLPLQVLLVVQSLSLERDFYLQSGNHGRSGS